ncbi:MAG: NAD(P) transhydrogenase subunit alpha [Firmicutes bacterium]|nr:NAD(P) transhydrogenase subunit alpha [Bacillota bacterium]
MKELLLVVLFIATALIGYKIIKNVPGLLHTPLMSGMNALSGIPILGALVATSAAISSGNRILGILAVFMASINIVGGFGITHKMLKMFRKEEK